MSTFRTESNSLDLMWPTFAELYEFLDCCGMVLRVTGVFCLLGVSEDFASDFPAGVG